MKLNFSVYIFSIFLLVNCRFTIGGTQDFWKLPTTCPKEELQEAIEMTRSCQKRADNSFLLAPSLTKLCGYLDETVNECTRQYALCFDDDYFARLRDATLRVHIDKMRKVYGIGESVLNCPIVREYKERTNKDEITFSSTDTCNHTKVSEVVSKFKSCGESAVRKMISEYRKTDSKLSTKKNIICRALDALMTECYVHMDQCFTKVQIASMRRRQGEFAATMFYRIADDLGFSIKSCPSFQNNVNESQQNEATTLSWSFSCALIVVLYFTVLK